MSSLFWIENFEGEDFGNDNTWVRKYIFSDSDAPVNSGAHAAFSGGNYMAPNVLDDVWLEFSTNNAHQGSTVSSFRMGWLLKITTHETNEMVLFHMDSNGGVQQQIEINPQWGQVQWMRGTFTLLESTSYPAFRASVYHYFEMQTEISNSISAGGCRMWIDGRLAIDLPAGTDTQALATTGVNQVVIVGTNQVAQYFDHFWVAISGQSGLGLTRAVTLFPNSTGDTSDLAIVGGSTSSISAVASSVPDDDTTYVHGSTLADLETWVLSAMSAKGSNDRDVISETATVHACQFNVIARRSDLTSTQEIDLIMKDATNSNNCAISATLDTTYSTFMTVFSAHPGGGAWEISDLQNVSFGVTIATVA